MGLGSHLVDLGFSDVGTLLCLLQLMRDLPQLGQVGVGGFLRFLGLPLVALDLQLQFVDQILEPGQVLLVLFSLVCQLLHSPLVLAHTFNSVSSASTCIFNLCLQLTHPGLQFLELLLASLHGQVLSLVQTVLQVLDGDLQVLLHPLQVSAGVLFLLQLLCHHGSISDGFLGLVLSIPCFLNTVVHFTLDLEQVSFKLLLGVQKACVLGVQQASAFTGVHQLLFSHFAASLCLFQSCSQLLDLSDHEAVPTLHHGALFLHVLSSSDGIVKVQLGVLKLSLDVPQLLLGLGCLAVGVAQLNLQLVEVSLHLLLDPQGVVPAPDLRVQGALHGVDHPLAVPLDLLHLLVLLRQLPVNLTLDLVELQLHTKDLGLLVLQSALSFLQGCLDLCLLCLHLLLGFLQLMDALSSLTDLFSQV